MGCSYGGATSNGRPDLHERPLTRPSPPPKIPALVDSPSPDTFVRTAVSCFHCPPLMYGTTWYARS